RRETAHRGAGRADPQHGAVVVVADRTGDHGNRAQGAPGRAPVTEAMAPAAGPGAGAGAGAGPGGDHGGDPGAGHRADHRAEQARTDPGAEPLVPAVLVIEPGGTSLLRYLRDLAHHRDLVQVLAKRDLTLRYRQTAIGVAWVVLQPLLAAG